MSCFTPLKLANNRSAMILLRAGASCKGLSKSSLNSLFRHACSVGDLSNVRKLLKNGCGVSTLSREEQEALLHCACREGDTLVAGTLVMSLYSVSTLPREEQEELLQSACLQGDAFLQGVYSVHSVHREITYLVDQLKRQEKGLLPWLSLEGTVLLVETLIAEGCNVNCVDSTRCTPLMKAACKGHEKIVEKLILAGADLTVQGRFGFTALHYAAIHNHIQCGILLAEAGASVMVKSNLSQTPLHIAKADLKEAITQALSFTTGRSLCIIGNAEGGKSTLIASLQAESIGLFGRMVNCFRRVDDCRH